MINLEKITYVTTYIIFKKNTKLKKYVTRQKKYQATYVACEKVSRATY